MSILFLPSSFCLSLSLSTTSTQPARACAFSTPPNFSLFSRNTCFFASLPSVSLRILSPKGQVLGTYIKWLGFSVLAKQPPENTGKEPLTDPTRISCSSLNHGRKDGAPPNSQCGSGTHTSAGSEAESPSRPIWN